jgi:probable addiction module antidote protein
MVRTSRRIIGGLQEGHKATMADYLSEALETGRKDKILEAVGSVARARGMTLLARETGINRTVLYSSLKEDANPTLETLLAIINALGLKLKAERAA